MIYQKVIYYYILYTSDRPSMLHKLLLGAFGIYSAYLTMSLLSQHLYNTQYKSTNSKLPPAKFTYAPLMVWLSCLFCSLAGYVISLVKSQPANPISIKQRLIMGGLFTINMVTTHSSLLYISYPVQVIGRSVRFLFVVIIGAFFSRVKKTNTHLILGRHKLLIAIIITVGVIGFNFAKDAHKDKVDKHDPKLQWLGFLLLGVSVLSDALFSDSQAYSKSLFKPTPNQLFTITNFYAFIFCFLYSLTVDRSLLPSLKFIFTHPAALKDIIVIGLLQLIGQISIYYIVTNFKQHIFPLISTTRMIMTVILSIIVFGHDTNKWQWISIAIVFSGMFYQFYEEIKHERERDRRHRYSKEAETAGNSASSQSEQTPTPKKD